METKYFFKAIGLIFLMSLGNGSADAFEGDPQAGKLKATTCAACHGAEGNSPMNTWPKLAGQNAKYLYNQLKAFKAGQSTQQSDTSRYNEVMTPLVANLSDQDLKDLAVYYASQKTSIGATPKNSLELGQNLYRGGSLAKQIAACSACHGPTGLGNPDAAFPRLSGQFALYTTKQLLDYQQGKRRNGINNIMPSIAARMSTPEIEAVAAYVEGLH